MRLSITALLLSAAVLAACASRASEGHAPRPVIGASDAPTVGAEAVGATTATSDLAPEVRAACRHAMVALVAATEPERVPKAKADWRLAEAEMYAAWRVGRSATDKAFVQKLLPEGALVPGDTQTLGEAIDVLARHCGIPLFY